MGSKCRNPCKISGLSKYLLRGFFCGRESYTYILYTGQNFIILISGVCLIRHPGWKKIPKNNKHPRTYICYWRVVIWFLVFIVHTNQKIVQCVCNLYKKVRLLCLKSIFHEIFLWFLNLKWVIIFMIIIKF